jgi:hypothetical protein
MKRTTTGLLLAAAAAGLPFLAVEGRAFRAETGAAAQAPAQGKETRTAYLRRVFEKDLASTGDACRMMLSLASGEHTDAEFATLRADLESRGIVEAAWELEESARLTKGTLAFMLARTLGVKGGLTASVLGMTRRYALKECVYLGLMEEGATGQYVTGRELIDVVTNAEIYRQEGSLDSLRK